MKRIVVNLPISYKLMGGSKVPHGRVSDKGRRVWSFSILCTSLRIEKDGWEHYHVFIAASCFVVSLKSKHPPLISSIDSAILGTRVRLSV